MAAVLLDRFIMRHVAVREVQDNRLELAVFIKKYFKVNKIWIEGEMTFWRVALGWLSFLFANGVMIGAACHIIRYAVIADEFHFSKITTDVSLLLGWPSAYLLFRTFYVQQKEWQALLKELGNFGEYEKPEGIELQDAKLEVILKLTMVMVAIPVPIMIVYILSADCPDPEDYACGIMFPSYFPGCMGSWRPLCALLNLCSSYSLSYFGHLASCFFSQISEYIVIYLKFFQGMLKKVPLITEWEERRLHMNMLLRYHQRILVLYETFFKLVKNAFLIHIFGTPIVLAVLVYTFLTDFKVQNVAYASLWMFSLSYVCFFGQRMFDESESVTEIAYDAIPFDGDNRTARDLMFLILRSQKTLYTPVGALTSCDKTLFLAVMKTTYSYLAVIQNTSATNAN